MIQTVIHKLSEDGTSCSLCQKPLTVPVGASPGEFVGVVSSTLLGSETIYRIGENNRDPLCDGSHAGLFNQRSLPKA